MTNTQIIRFLENDDATIIHFKKFNLSPDGVYPGFSLCFSGPRLYWYDDELIFNVTGIMPETYEKMLKGEQVHRYEYNYTSRLYRKVALGSISTSINNFEKFYLTKSQIITGVEYVTEDEKHSVRYGKGENGKLLEEVPLHIGYKSPDTICFTRDSKDPLESLRVHDWISFNRSIFGNGKYGNVKLRIFLHRPQQLLRSFHRPVFTTMIGQADEGKGNQFWSNLLRITISKVMVLKKRPASNVPCNPDLRNDDDNLQLQIITLVGCIPIYWEKTVGGQSTYKTCRTQSELSLAYYYLQQYKKIFSTYYPPCSGMEIWSVFDKEEHNQWGDPRIQFHYTETEYEEIANTQGFGIESFVSGVGGFVGIFLGYSILQLPELVASLPSLFQKFMSYCTPCESHRQIKVA